MLRRIIVTALCSLVVAGAAQADQKARYEVTISNVTKGQSFTPLLVVTHKGNVAMFELGTTASPGLGRMAEGGDTALLLEELMMHPGSVGDAQTIQGAAGLLVPGETASVVVTASRAHRYLSLAGMLLPTNDNFVALNRIRLPRSSTTRLAPAYDAGTEYNDQNCGSIPGPLCGGEPFSDPSDTDEGYVYIGNGFHELPEAEGVLGPHDYDWRNPVARIVVRRLHH